MDGIPSLYQQLIAHVAAHPVQARVKWPMNPFPSGVRVGSVTDKVLAIAVLHHPRWFEHHELMRLTGASRGGISWAVRYLQERNMMRSIRSARHPSYLRYQAVKHG